MSSTLDLRAVRQAIADQLTDLGFSTLPFDPVAPRAQFASVGFPTIIAYGTGETRSLNRPAEMDIPVTLTVGTADEASANATMDLALSWNVDGAIPFELERRCANLADRPWRQLFAMRADNWRPIFVNGTEGYFLAVDLHLRVSG